MSLFNLADQCTFDEEIVCTIVSKQPIGKNEKIAFGEGKWVETNKGYLAIKNIFVDGLDSESAADLHRRLEIGQTFKLHVEGITILPTSLQRIEHAEKIKPSF